MPSVSRTGDEKKYTMGKLYSVGEMYFMEGKYFKGEKPDAAVKYAP